MGDRRIRPIDFPREDIDRCQIALVADPDFFEPLRIFAVGQKWSRAELRRPLEWNAVLTFARPLTLQIGLAPQRAPAPRAFMAPSCAGVGAPPPPLPRGRDRQPGCRHRQDAPSFHVSLPR